MFVGKRVLVRSRISGVSVGKLESLTHEGGQSVAVLRDGVRIWSWSGAFTCSEIATKGAVCRVVVHPKRVLIADEGLEVLRVSGSAWKVIKGSWSEGAE